MKAFLTTWTLAVLLGVLVGCGPVEPSNSESTAPVPDNARAYQVKGVLYELKPDGVTATIRHEEVPGYMAAMVMPFTARDPAELAEVTPGDEIEFRLLVTDSDAWIDGVRKTGRSLEVPRATARTAEFDSLEVGDPMPDCTLTNDAGRTIRLHDYRGTTLALTFFFTRCPLPTYCPLMSQNFAEAYRMLTDDPDAPSDWKMLSISFDPEFDTPRVLRVYAKRYRSETNRWSYATGSMDQIERIGRPLGLMLVRERGTISHNLRTVVLDKSGKIARLFTDNTWKGEELAAAIREAASRAVERDAGSAGIKSTLARLEISGMSCDVCAKTIRSHLLKEPGVQSVELVWTNMIARLTFDSGQTSVSRLEAIVKDLGYGAETR